ncbi:MAG TPA: 2-dehydropantoate 2-reductase [Gemmatimonadaceae bacterium]|jgi:2-dehydropantoate 2-reductase|nr:2-dehydropantoate 2-reductase [Gemmatimonadaceae bacterium]
MNVGFVGGGGIGSYYAGLLTRAGHDVRLITRGDHLRAIVERGLDVRTPESQFIVRPRASDDGGILTGCEYVVVAVKGYSIPEVAPMIAAAARDGAAVIPLLNGVDAAERLSAAGVPREKILGGLATVSVFRTAPGVVERKSPIDRIIVGGFDRKDHALSVLSKRFATALSDAGVSASASDDIRLDLWRKFALIVPMTVASGLTRRPMGATLATSRGRDLVAGCLAEIAAVSRGGDTPLSNDDEARIRADLFALPASMRPSFLADLERGGPTEVEMLAGAVSRIGRERGVPTPIHDVAAAVFEAATLPMGGAGGAGVSHKT